MMELLDGFMEQVEVMAKELKNISGGICALVEGIGRLTVVVEGAGKKGVRKEDKEMETEDVQGMDKQTESQRQKRGRKTVKKRRRVRKKKEKKTAGKKMEIRRWRKWRRSR
jgi:hypothetical protein